MKRLDEMSHKEIVALKEEGIQMLIDLRCAEEGVRLEPELPPQPKKPDVSEDMVGYEIAGVFTLDGGFAKELQELMRKNSAKLAKLTSDYQISYDYKFLKDLGGEDRADLFAISEKLFFSRDKFERNKEALRTYKQFAEAWESAKNDFDKITRARAGIASDIRTDIEHHIAEDRELERMRKEYARYVDLAKGDKEIATSFFSKAYDHLGEEIRELVKKELGITMLDPEKTEEDADEDAA